MKYLFVFLIVFSFIGCSEKTNRVSEDKFIGLWELAGRSSYNGIQIRIKKEHENLTGIIEKLNSNKIVNMFSEVGDTWVSTIKRTSNYEFKLTERKIARELFSIYGQSTSQEYKMQLLNDSTIGLSTTDPRSATIFYKKIQ